MQHLIIKMISMLQFNENHLKNENIMCTNNFFKMSNPHMRYCSDTIKATSCRLRHLRNLIYLFCFVLLGFQSHQDLESHMATSSFY